MKLNYQSSHRIFFIIAAFVISINLNGCPDTKSSLYPDNEEFVGTYMVRDSLETEHVLFTDSIIFSVIQGTTYSIDFLNAVNAQGKRDLCSHSGTIFDFGTAKASFIPTSISYIDGVGCDSAAIPRGIFAADFINHGDTIYLYRRATDLLAGVPYDSVYLLKLLK